MKKVRALFSILVLICGFTAVLADSGHPVRVSEHPELRALLATHIRFVAKPKIKALPAPVWSTRKTMADMPPPAAVGPDVVRMPPFYVNGDRAFRELRSAVQRQEMQARVRRSYRRLGIGVRHLRLGKVSIYVATIFDIPFMIGMGSPPTNEHWGPTGRLGLNR